MISYVTVKRNSETGGISSLFLVLNGERMKKNV